MNEKTIQLPPVNDQELATLLAALRFFQEHAEKIDLIESEHFEDVEPPTLEQIDDLCERLNIDSTRL